MTVGFTGVTLHPNTPLKLDMVPSAILTLQRVTLLCPAGADKNMQVRVYLRTNDVVGDDVKKAVAVLRPGNESTSLEMALSWEDPVEMSIEVVGDKSGKGVSVDVVGFFQLYPGEDSDDDEEDDEGMYFEEMMGQGEDSEDESYEGGEGPTFEMLDADGQIMEGDDSDDSDEDSEEEEEDSKSDSDDSDSDEELTIDPKVLFKQKAAAKEAMRRQNEEEVAKEMDKANAVFKKLNANKVAKKEQKPVKHNQQQSNQRPGSSNNKIKNKNKNKNNGKR